MYLEFTIFCPDETKELVMAELMNGSTILMSRFYNHDVPDFEKLVKTIGLKIAKVKERNDWASIIIEQC